MNDTWLMPKYLPCGLFFIGYLTFGECFSASISLNLTLICSITFLEMTRLIAHFQVCRIGDSSEVELDRLFASNEFNARFTCSLCNCASRGVYVSKCDRDVDEWTESLCSRFQT